MTGSVGIYARMSIDKGGRREGVETQEKWGREYAAQLWPDLPVRVFTDNHLSAARGDTRPGFEAFRVAVQAGELRHVWAVEQSRLDSRVEAVWFELAAELDAAGIEDLHTRRDGIVRVRDDVAGIKAVISAGERRKMLKRVNDRLGERAAQGRPHGSVPFGYRRAVNDDGVDTWAIVPEQADAVRWAADSVLAGWSLTNVARELHRRGHVGARGGSITTSSLSRLLTSPAVAGKRVHSGEIVGAANWPPILTDDVWQAVRSRLSNPRKVRTAHGAEFEIPADRLGVRPPRKYLLTGGLTVCGVCGGKMVGAAKTMRDGGRRPYLSCAQTAGGRGCVGIMLDSAEAYVVELLLDELDRPEFLDAIAADGQAERRDELAHVLTGLDLQRAELARMWAAGGMSTSEWQAARAGLDVREHTARAELAAIPPPVGRVDIGDVRAAWPEMTLDERREILRLFISRVVVSPARPGTRAFDPDRINIEWRLS